MEDRGSQLSILHSLSSIHPSVRNDTVEPVVNALRAHAQADCEASGHEMDDPDSQVKCADHRRRSVHVNGGSQCAANVSFATPTAFL